MDRFTHLVRSFSYGRLRAGRALYLLPILILFLLVGVSACGKQSSITNPVIGQDPTPPNPDPFIYSVTLASDKGEVDSSKTDAKDRTITFTAITSFVPSGVSAPGIWVRFTYTFNGVTTVRSVQSDATAKAIDTYIAPLGSTGTLTAQACVTNSTGVTNCATVSVRVIKPLTITPAKAEFPCVGAAYPGTATFTVTGGTPTYTFSIQPAIGTLSTTTGTPDPSTVTYTPPGACVASDTKVTLTVVDSAGASVSAEITLKASGAAGTLTVTPPSATVGASTNVGCNNGGTQVFVVSGGTAPYTFIPSGGTVTGSPGSGPFTYTAGCAAGTYTQIVTDSSSPSLTGTATVTIP